ncbi:hypothetical protein LZ554_007298 [Drepanopeziza brunnea f. sp. 'monogermtubi']|nr:hypothetical protein LZ554_007298 [Drepanopeziza brunnea f. sp. 'monogermtubi']
MVVMSVQRDPRIPLAVAQYHIHVICQGKFEKLWGLVIQEGVHVESPLLISHEMSLALQFVYMNWTRDMIIGSEWIRWQPTPFVFTLKTTFHIFTIKVPSQGFKPRQICTGRPSFVTTFDRIEKDKLRATPLLLPESIRPASATPTLLLTSSGFRVVLDLLLMYLSSSRTTLSE